MRYLVLLIFFLPVIAHSQAPLLAHYDASAGEAPADPATEGWEVIRGQEALAEPLRDGDESVWRIGSPQSNVNHLCYRWNFTDRDTFQVQAWRLSARLRVHAASAEKTRDAYLDLQDGKSEWTLGFIKLKDGREEIAYINRENRYETLAPVPMGYDFFEVRMDYSAETDAVSVFFNGELIGSPLQRTDVPAVPHPSRISLAWGDGSVAALPTDARTEVDWQSVKLEALPYE